MRCEHEEGCKARGYCIAPPGTCGYDALIDENAAVAGLDEFASEAPAETPDREYLITATVQFIVSAAHETEARIAAKELLDAFIGLTDFYQDPMNGHIIENIEDLTTDEHV